LCIDSFAGVQDEGGPDGRGFAGFEEIPAESEGMCPSILLDDPDREVVPLKLRPKGIVVAHRRYPTEKIADGSPPKARCSWYEVMRCDHICIVAVKIFSPLNVVAIRGPAKLWIEGKLQMVMRVEQTWKKEETR